MPSTEPLVDWTERHWFLDSNVIDHQQRTDLLRLADLQWVWLSVTDTAHVETSQKPDKHAVLLDHLERFDVSRGTEALRSARRRR